MVGRWYAQCNRGEHNPRALQPAVSPSPAIGAPYSTFCAGPSRGEPEERADEAQQEGYFFSLWRRGAGLRVSACEGPAKVEEECGNRLHRVSVGVYSGKGGTNTGKCERGVSADRGGVQPRCDEVDLHPEGVDGAGEEEEETGYCQGEDSRAGHIFREGWELGCSTREGYVYLPVSAMM